MRIPCPLESLASIIDADGTIAVDHKKLHRILRFGPSNAEWGDIELDQVPAAVRAKVDELA